MTEGVKVFLIDLGMLKYYDMFKAKGFDDESDIPHLTMSDLKDTLMISDISDRTTILGHAYMFKTSSEHALFQWLSSNSLSYYFISFIQSELTDLKKIAQLSLPNEDLYDELEIILPGHRKRLERAVHKLKLDHLKDAAVETPVTHGWWGKPDCLPQAKFDFLCVRASLFSPSEPQTVAKIDFMVDSGSDVSTVQENTLKQLNLDLIGPVYSCGIHGGNHTNLYKGRLKVGNQEMDIEVMGSNYDSLGSRVVRHFRHVIDGHQHIWLKGNYADPLPAILPITFPIQTSTAAHSSSQKAPLALMAGDHIETTLSQLSPEARTLAGKDIGVNSEVQPSDIIVSPISTDIIVSPVSTELASIEHRQHLSTGIKQHTLGAEFQSSESVSDRIISASQNSPSSSRPQSSSDRISISHNSLSSKDKLNPPSSINKPNFLQSRHSVLKIKTKQSTKLLSSGTKSSIKRPHHSSSSSSPKEFSKKFLHSRDGNPRASLIQKQASTSKAISDSWEFSTGSVISISDSWKSPTGSVANPDSQASPTESVANPDSGSNSERVLQSNVVPAGVRYNGDEVDCNEVLLSTSNLRYYSPNNPQVNANSSLNVSKFLNEATASTNGTVNGFEDYTHKQICSLKYDGSVANDVLKTNFDDVVYIDGLDDVVHVDGLNDDESCNGFAEVDGLAEMNRNFISACHKITVIPLYEMDSDGPT